MATDQGSPDRPPSRAEVRSAIDRGLAEWSMEGKRVLVIIPDSTRTMPMPLMFGLFRELVGGRAAALDYLVALGTHPRMSDDQLSRLLGTPVRHGQVGGSHVFQHEWDDPAALRRVGIISAREIEEITNGWMAEDVPVSVNKRIFDYDQLIICGPVFPHEVAGFSGGTKYIFPGIGGPEMINFTHWLGALITSTDVIGTAQTPVRAVIDRGAAFITVPTACVALVVDPSDGDPAGDGDSGIAGVFCGPTQQAWKEAAALSARRHIKWVDRPFNKVLSMMPPMYDELWTAGKGMYKLEPAVADGGEIIIYAPHITRVSATHGQLIDQIGYHCRDYFVKQWDRFKDVPWGVLAHSTHVKGRGIFDPTSGIESARIHVTLATGIPAERCERLNLGYQNPDAIDVGEWQGRASEGIMVVPRAGETLYRLKTTAAS
jgi:nickel-dependent lactate racemase